VRRDFTRASERQTDFVKHEAQDLYNTRSLLYKSIVSRDSVKKKVGNGVLCSHGRQKTFICQELSNVRSEHHFSTPHVIVGVNEFVNKFAPRDFSLHPLVFLPFLSVFLA
jgi:hypothetical protein